MKIKRAVFLSYLINEQIPIYGGKGPIVLKRERAIKRGDSCNTMLWSFPNHIGTHIDMPLHFIENGRSISGLSPSDLIFNKVRLVKTKNIAPGDVIDKDGLKNVRDCGLLLIKTYSGSYRDKDIYWKNSISLSPALAGWLKKKCPSLRAVGIDSISISNINSRKLGREAHKAFLGRGIMLIEDMKLRKLETAPDLVIVAPILVEKADGSPCTVLGIYN